MWDWIAAQRDILGTLGVVSAVMFFGSALIRPWIALRLPVDALNRPNPLDSLGRRHPIARVLVFVVRNVIGVPILLAGIIMLVTPGQGILTILLALLASLVPARMVSRQSVKEAIAYE